MDEKGVILSRHSMTVLSKTGQSITVTESMELVDGGTSTCRVADVRFLKTVFKMGPILMICFNDLFGHCTCIDFLRLQNVR